MNNKTINERFEEAYLAGRDRENPMVACLVTKYVGHEEYSNPNTQAMFQMFLKGREDAGGVNAELLKALERIARPMDCGCKPCTGQCSSREALLAELEACYEYASDAIAKAKAVQS